LGYVTSSSGSTRPVGGIDPRMMDQKTMDPKDKVELSNAMTDAVFALEAGREEEAIGKLQSILAKDPKIVSAYDALATAWMRAGDIVSATDILRKSVEMFPERGMVHFQLAMALIQNHDLKAAEPELMAAVGTMPNSAQVHYELARLYFNTARKAQAKNTALEAIKLQPKHYEANLMVGAISLAGNDASGALPYLQRASASRPDASKPHQYMAQAYSLLGEEVMANREAARAQLLERQESTGHK
jgi:predicted Zn-dependent protease